MIVILRAVGTALLVASLAAWELWLDFSIYLMVKFSTNALAGILLGLLIVLVVLTTLGNLLTAGFSIRAHVAGRITDRELQRALLFDVGGIGLAVMLVIYLVLQSFGITLTADPRGLVENIVVGILALDVMRRFVG